MSNSISRLAAYLRRHSLGDTLSRARVELHRALFANRMIIYYCDLTRLPVSTPRPSSFALERLSRLDALPAQDLHDMTSFWNPPQAAKNIREQFAQGALLWLVKSEGRVAGYGWTIQGRTMSPYYFRLGQDDVSLFDFYVFPQFRGRALHWLLTSHILKSLAAEGRTRAFADTAEWNDAQIASFKLTPFRRLGMVRSHHFLGRTYITWIDEPAAAPARQPAKARAKSPVEPAPATPAPAKDPAPSLAKSHE